MKKNTKKTQMSFKALYLSLVSDDRREFAVKPLVNWREIRLCAIAQGMKPVSEKWAHRVAWEAWYHASQMASFKAVA